LASIAGIAMAIYGGIQSADSATLATNNWLKVSVIIFVACYLAFMCLFLISYDSGMLSPRPSKSCFSASHAASPSWWFDFSLAFSGLSMKA
jgi:hypothetical protein